MTEDKLQGIIDRLRRFKTLNSEDSQLVADTLERYIYILKMYQILVRSVNVPSYYADMVVTGAVL